MRRDVTHDVVSIDPMLKNSPYHSRVRMYRKLRNAGSPNEPGRVFVVPATTNASIFRLEFPLVQFNKATGGGVVGDYEQEMRLVIGYPVALD